jgi:thiol-disulfide isomerase/thioredoxin/DNA-directed RNA polymerase subunit RPC12/RpoP
MLCPNCRVQVKRDNLGEFLCPNCNARLCPKAHIFYGKICPYCGWEDPNYSLWQKAQKAKLHRPQSKVPDESTEIKTQYICPNCGVSVESINKDCPNCGLLGAKYRVVKAAPTGAMSAPASPSIPTKPILDSIPREPVMKRASKPAKSAFVKEVARAEPRQWKFPSLRQFVRPALASLLSCIIITGLVFGGIYANRFFSRNAEPGIPPPATAVTPSKTYTLSTNVVPATGGKIDTVPPLSADGTFEPGSQVTLTAVPDNCHTFSCWDGLAESSETVTITMDSNKSITANFRLKETTPPIISQVKANCNSDIGAIITWLTDKPATGQVDYGKTKEYGLTAVSNDELTNDHSIHLTRLEPNTTYYFKVKSADECGSEASDTKMLITLREISCGERVGQRAIDFTLPYYNAQSLNKSGTEALSTYIGEKKILLNFWSTYCGACIGEFPLIRGIYEDENFANRNSADSDFVVFTVCIDSKINEAPGRIEILEDKFSDEAGPFTFPILMDSVGQTKKDYHIWTIPETVFIDSDGIIREIKIGRFQNIEEIEAILNSLN